MARRGLILLALLAVQATAAHAGVPLPDWREEVIVATWERLDAQITEACSWPEGSAGVGRPLGCDEAKLDRAIAWGRQVLRDVANDGRIHYLIGLAERHAGRADKAEQALREATTLSPDRAEAWADLGDLLVARKAWDEADAAIRQVIRLNPEGPAAWYGWLQLAQVAGWRQQPGPFEDAVREAIRLGFSLRTVTGNAAWKGFYADPVMRPTVERVVGTYAEPGVLDSLRP